MRWVVEIGALYENDPEAPRLGDPRHFEMQPAFLKKSLNRERWFWRWDTPEKYKLNMRAYYRILTGMDGVVGRVRETLAKRGFADNTVIIYTADNGYYMSNEHHMNNESIPKWRGVRGERYTYARYYEQQPAYEFLHDLQVDPDQTKNLAEDPGHAAVLKRMRERTDEYTEKFTRPEIVELKRQLKK